MNVSDKVIDTLVSDSVLQTGGYASILEARKGIARPVQVTCEKRAQNWSTAEDEFLVNSIGKLSYWEIARQLGRSEISIHIRIVRKGISTASKRSGYITANKLANLLSLDVHTICGWIDEGRLPGEFLPMDRNIRRVSILNLKIWLTRPENWPYFKVERIKNGSIRHLVELAMKRWGDEWWSIPQVAEYHKCDRGLVNKHLHLGDLEGIRCPNIGGRDRGTWAHWFIRKSVAIAWIPPRIPGGPPVWTDRSDEFIIRARREGKMFKEIAAMMKWPQKRIEYRTHLLKKEGRL